MSEEESRHGIWNSDCFSLNRNEELGQWEFEAFDLFRRWPPSNTMSRRYLSYRSIALICVDAEESYYPSSFSS
ncbi:hypothetical protein HJC23_006206 [Cyclotella cryptica]|uniref:Uncharacterized protein n=1 Tax=Cyclotella cryptica TaxID=29204 RepID=A0ABD3PVV7_9STRA